METYETRIISNGSKWAGDEPDSVDQLCEVLASYALDRTFELYGNFIIEPTIEHDTFVRFFGNFANLSHVFSIDSNDPAVIARLTGLIRANQQRSDYLSQHKPKPYSERIAEQSARLRRNAKGGR